MGTNANSAALIGDMAADLGFKLVRPYMGVADSERLAKIHPVNFFLFDYSQDFEKTKSQITELRMSHQLRVRFAPLICFVESPSKDIIVDCVNAGFDDILTLPWSALKTRERLAKQINNKSTYFETDTYFGPDRRRFSDDGKTRKQAAPAPGFGFRLYEFVRNNHVGVQIMHDRVVGKAPKRQSAALASAVNY